MNRSWYLLLFLPLVSLRVFGAGTMYTLDLGTISLSDKDPPLAVPPLYTAQLVSQSYIDNYLLWTIKPINTSAWQASFQMDPALRANLTNCMKLTGQSQDSCLSGEVAQKWFPGYNQTQALIDLKNFANYPLTTKKGNVVYSQKSIDVQNYKGSFIINVVPQKVPDGLPESWSLDLGFGSTTILISQNNGGVPFLAMPGVGYGVTFYANFSNQTANLTAFNLQFYQYAGTTANITANLWVTDNSTHMPKVDLGAFAVFNAADGTEAYVNRNFTTIRNITMNRSIEYAIIYSVNTSGAGAYAIVGGAHASIASRDISNYTSGNWHYATMMHFNTWVNNKLDTQSTNGGAVLYSSASRLAIRFTPTASGNLTNVSTVAYQYFTPGTALLYNLTNGTNDEPGTTLVNGTLGRVNGSTMSQAYLERPLLTTSPNIPNMSNTTKYWLVIGMDDQDGASGLALEIDPTNGADNVTLLQSDNGGAWQNFTEVFTVYIDEMPNATSPGSTAFNSTSFYFTNGNSMYFTNGNGVLVK